jgi:hypothetical protein
MGAGCGGELGAWRVCYRYSAPARGAGLVGLWLAEEIEGRPLALPAEAAREPMFAALVIEPKPTRPLPRR